MQAKEILELRVGAQVMLVKNVSQSQGLVNGARGVVEKFVGSTSVLPVIRFANVSFASLQSLRANSTGSHGAK